MPAQGWVSQKKYKNTKMQKYKNTKTQKYRVEHSSKSEGRAGDRGAGSSTSTLYIRPGGKSTLSVYQDENTFDDHNHANSADLIFELTLQGSGLLPMAAPWGRPLSWSWPNSPPAFLWGVSVIIIIIFILITIITILIIIVVVTNISWGIDIIVIVNNNNNIIINYIVVI